MSLLGLCVSGVCAHYIGDTALGVGARVCAVLGVVVSGVCASCVALFGREPSPLHDSPKPLASGRGAWLKEFPKEF